MGPPEDWLRAEISINIRVMKNINLRCQVAQDFTCCLGSGPGPGVVECGGAASFFCLRALRWGTERHAGLARGEGSGDMGGLGGGGSAGGLPGAPEVGFLQRR